jgi:gas vesicle protein
MMRATSFLIGFIVGMAIGGAVGMFLAPRSGPATREQLKRRWNEALEEGRQAAERSRAEAHARLADLKAK